MPKKQKFNRGEIVIYQSSKKEVELRVRLEGETIWLDAHQIASLFGVYRPAIVKHINNIYKSGELNKKSTCSILEQVAADGKLRRMNIYNLDMIISVGYRVNSKRATQFRVWATDVLKKHLIKGYTINQKRLLQAQDKFKELQETISFLREKSGHELLAGQEREILNLLGNYSKTLTLLEQYDKETLRLSKKSKGGIVLSTDEFTKVIETLKLDLIAKGEASQFFGQEYGSKFKAISGKGSSH